MDFDSIFPSSPLHDAVAVQDFETVGRLLDAGADINSHDFIGRTPLTIACSSNSREVRDLRKNFGELTDKSADSTRRPRRKDKPIDLNSFDATAPKLDFGKFMAAGYERPVRDDSVDDDPSMVKQLVDYGADVNLISKLGETALNTAASAGRSKTVELLLDRGAALDAVGGEGGTALMYAAEEGHRGLRCKGYRGRQTVVSPTR